jgi:hypothetical protein
VKGLDGGAWCRGNRVRTGIGVVVVVGIWIAESHWESRSAWSCLWAVVRVSS